MASGRQKGGAGRPRPGQPPGTLGRLAFRLASQLFGGQMTAAVEPERRPVSPPRQEPALEPDPAQAAGQAARILEGALAQVEALLGRLEPAAQRNARMGAQADMTGHELLDVAHALRDVVARLDAALQRIDAHAERVSDEASRLSVVADRLEARLLGLARSLHEGGAPAEPAPALAREHAEPAEPRFLPDNGAFEVVIADVPGFQELMDVQRGLSDLPEVEGASVDSFRNGQAALAVILLAPVSASTIVQGLHGATGHDVLIEEARPEAARLRLRFTNGGAGAQPHG